MADGSARPIETLRPGDEVLATDPETDGTSGEKVTAKIEGVGDKILIVITVEGGGDTITATDKHPFWVESKVTWVDAARLHPGDLLIAPDGSRVRVLAVAAYGARAAVHNLTVANLHTYYVLAGTTPVLVHNAGGEACDIPSRPGLLSPDHQAVGDPGARGGIYALVTENGTVVRTGMATDLVSRLGRHRRDYPGLIGVVLYRTDDLHVRRGLEEMVENWYSPILARQDAIDLRTRSGRFTYRRHWPG
jgi:hypothetical protein